MNCACAIKLKDPHSSTRRQDEAAAALFGPEAREAMLHQVGTSRSGRATFREHPRGWGGDAKVTTMIAAVIFMTIAAARAQTAYLQQFDNPEHTEPYTRSAMRMASAGVTCSV